MPIFNVTKKKEMGGEMAKRIGKRNSTYFPKLLSSIFSRHALENLDAARMFINKVGHIVHTLVNNDVEAALRVIISGHLGWREHFVGHISGREGNFEIWNLIPALVH